ncbi:BMP family lipoprotein [Levilactobacillus bambusae]|uniref:BMP family lipoprotein n=1 Tax=Levilactobacillus bambusae TaxID=2024736 RepID=UPI001CDA8ADE|nr:BMP family ABC transporter substrate-binding protein [Levilactobacillus bambusae]
MKKALATSATALAIIGLGITLTGCGHQSTANGEKTKSTTHTVALVTDGGGIDDKSFNQSAWEGMKAWGKEHGLSKGVHGYNYAQSTSNSDFAPNINKLIKANYKTIFGIGFNLQQTVSDAAQANPKTNFAIVDAVVPNRKNVASATFQTEQSSYLAGVATALSTKTNRVGFIGGQKSAVISTFQAGFTEGVHAVNPKIKVDVKYAGSFTAPDKGQSLATAMYNNQEDVIMTAAGGTGNGVFTAAKNLAKDGKKVWVIGADRDQKSDGAYKGGNVTLTSTIKNVGSAVEDLSNRAMKDQFPGGEVLKYNLKNHGVDISRDGLSAQTWQKVQAAKEAIISGKTKVSDTVK